MRPARFLARFRRDRSGGTAVEFALVLPAFVMLVLGVISAGQLAHATNSLHYAVEEAARCWAVNATLCPNNSAAEAYAQSKYLGPRVEPEFVASTIGCGRTVTANGVFQLHAAIATFAVPITAQACYPSVDGGAA